MARCEKLKSTLVSKNITVLGKRTSVRLEPEMWRSLDEISKRENCKIHDLCSIIALRKNPNTSLTAAIRVFLMLYFRAAATEDGHKKAQHGDFMNMVKRAGLVESSPILLSRKQVAESFIFPVAGKKSARSSEHDSSQHRGN